ncbi:MAG: tetratricopeptide repeat protein, partial [Phycisphaerales bacterium]|nr:tetratricopeptide repeat protein [Phycisphaerales bacterium]
MSVAATEQHGDALRKAGDLPGAIDAYRAALAGDELPDAELALKLARTLVKAARDDEALDLLASIPDVTESFTIWQAASSLLSTITKRHTPAASRIRRSAKVAVLGSYTTTQLVPMLSLAAWREGILLTTYEAAYGQYRQDILDPNSALYAFAPDFVVLATHAGEVMLPDFSDEPAADVDVVVAQWSALWSLLAERSGAHIVHHNVAIPDDTPFGHQSVRLPGSRYAMLHAFNRALGEAAGSAVSVVDCNRLAGMIGTRRWFDDRYWHVAKQAVSLEALPILARHTNAVIAAALGLSRKCLVLDLDNTLWG